MESSVYCEYHPIAELFSHSCSYREQVEQFRSSFFRKQRWFSVKSSCSPFSIVKEPLHTSSFRKLVVSGSMSLPVMAVVTLFLWLLPGLHRWDLWAGLGVAGLTTYLLMELNNRNSLLRVRSRMISVTYLFLLSFTPFLHSGSLASFLPLLLVLSYFMLFASYQRNRPEGYIYHAFLLLGIGSLVFPYFGVLAFGFWFSMIFQLRSFTWRSLMASFLGLLTPYWLYAAYLIFNHRLRETLAVPVEMFRPEWIDLSQLPLSAVCFFGVLLVLTIIAFAHFFYTAYNDKIRTRMLFYTIAIQEVLLAAGLLFFFRYMAELSGIFLLNSSFLLAHYYALAKGRAFNAWFNLSLFLLLALGLWNYCAAF